MWYLQPKWRNRLLVETELMRERFPLFAPIRTTNDALVWRGILRPTRTGKGYVVAVELPANYPYAAPILRVEQPALQPGSPHRYANGSLCIHRQSWEPTRGTIASVVPLAAAWLVAYEHWLRTGEDF